MPSNPKLIGSGTTRTTAGSKLSKSYAEVPPTPRRFEFRKKCDCR